jgi:acyl-CoA reductase-like NAD-dependent aldehyde dehydrogenase
MSYINDSTQKGGKILIGGTPHFELNKKNNNNSYFFMPTVLTNINNTMTLYNNEIFGPVISITKFKSEEEVIELANDTKFFFFLKSFMIIIILNLITFFISLLFLVRENIFQYTI